MGRLRIHQMVILKPLESNRLSYKINFVSHRDQSQIQSLPN